MKIYVADKNFSIKLQALDNEKSQGFIITDDQYVYSLDTGSDVFSCTIFSNNMDHKILRNIQCGEYIFVETIQGFNTYNLYQIITADYDMWNHTLQIYAESAGLELLGSIAEAWTSPSMVTIKDAALHFLPSYWQVRNVDIGTNLKSVSWESEVSVVERLLDIAKKWDARMFYTFTIVDSKLTTKTVNFCKKSTKRNPIFLDKKEINNIIVKKSLEDFCTAFKPLGATPDTVDDNKTLPPINLKGYAYTYTDPDTGDFYYVDSSSGLLINRTQRFKWSGPLNESGLIIRPYSYDTLEKAMLAGQARAELQKVSHPSEIYEIDLQNIDKNITIDDFININLPEEDINILAKVIQIEKSVTTKTNKINVEVI